MDVRCQYCGKPVNLKAKNVWRRVMGWEKQRTAGEGVMPIKDRTYLGAVAHDLCLEVELHGGGQQGSLAV